MLLILEKFLLEAANKIDKSLINIKNFKIIRDLNYVSHVFMSKNSLIEPNNSQINGFVMIDKYIEFNENEETKIKKYFSSKKEMVHGIYYNEYQIILNHLKNY